MRLTLRIALACAALLALPAAAHAGFTSQPIRISGDTDISTFPASAADARGNVVVIWTERVAPVSRLLARRVRPDGAREVGANSVVGTLLQPPDGPGTSGVDIAPTTTGVPSSRGPGLR